MGVSSRLIHKSLGCPNHYLISSSACIRPILLKILQSNNICYGGDIRVLYRGKKVSVDMDTDLFLGCLNDRSVNRIALIVKLVNKTIVNRREAHLNAIYIDKNTREVELFEPNGEEDTEYFPNVMEIVKSQIQPLFPTGIYIPPRIMCPSGFGPQYKQGEYTEKIKLGDLGLCSWWSMYYLYLRGILSRRDAIQKLESLTGERAWEAIDDFISEYLGTSMIDSLKEISSKIDFYAMPDDEVITASEMNIDRYFLDRLYRANGDEREKFAESIPAVTKNLTDASYARDDEWLDIIKMYRYMNLDQCGGFVTRYMLDGLFSYATGDLKRARAYWSLIPTPLLRCTLSMYESLDLEMDSTTSHCPVSILTEILWLQMEYRFHSMENMIDILFAIVESKISSLDVSILTNRLSRIATDRLREFSGDPEQAETKIMKWIIKSCQTHPGATERNYQILPYILQSKTMLQ